MNTNTQQTRPISLDKTLKALRATQTNGGVTLALDGTIKTYPIGYQVYAEFEHYPIIIDTSKSIDLVNLCDTLNDISAFIGNTCLEGGYDTTEVNIGLWTKGKLILVEPSFYFRQGLLALELAVQEHQEAFYDWKYQASRYTSDLSLSVD